VISYLKAPRRQIPKATRHAFLEIEYLSAVPTMKMMVMPLVGTLISRGLTRQLHAGYQAVIKEVFKRAVDSGNPERRDSFKGKAEDVVRQQGAILIFQNRLDRFLLPSCASFDSQVKTMNFSLSYFKPSTMAETLCLIMES